MIFGARLASFAAVIIIIGFTNGIFQIVTRVAGCGFTITVVGALSSGAVGDFGCITFDTVGTAVVVGVRFAGAAIFMLSTFTGK